MGEDQPHLKNFSTPRVWEILVCVFRVFGEVFGAN